MRLVDSKFLFCIFCFEDQSYSRANTTLLITHCRRTVMCLSKSCWKVCVLIRNLFLRQCYVSSVELIPSLLCLLKLPSGRFQGRGTENCGELCSMYCKPWTFFYRADLHNNIFSFCNNIFFFCNFENKKFPYRSLKRVFAFALSTSSGNCVLTGEGWLVYTNKFAKKGYAWQRHVPIHKAIISSWEAANLSKGH